MIKHHKDSVMFATVNVTGSGNKLTAY